MKRDIYLSSLTVGRCFTVSPNAKKDDDDDLPTGSFRIGQTIITPSLAWKVTSVTPENISAQNVSGDTADFEPSLLVVEISREGFDRMAGRNA